MPPENRMLFTDAVKLDLPRSWVKEEDEWNGHKGPTWYVHDKGMMRVLG